MAVKIVDSTNQELLFNLKKEKYPIYFTLPYHQFEQALGYETGYFNSNNEIFMPFRVYKKWLFRFVQIMYPPLKNGVIMSEAEEKLFLNECVSSLKSQNKYHRIIQPFIMDVFQTFPDESDHCEFGQLYLNIDGKSEEEIFSGFQARYRSQIRSAANDNLSLIKNGETEIENCYELYKNLHQRQSMYHDNKSYFTSLKECLQKEEVFFYTAYYNNIPQCSALITLKNNEAYYLFGGSVPKTAHQGIIKLMHWEIIKKIKSLGVKKYIWGGCRLSDVSGTKQQGMQEFKLRFGSEIKKGYLWKIDINKSYSNFYDFLIAFQHKMKGKQYKGDVIDYEKNRAVII